MWRGGKQYQLLLHRVQAMKQPSFAQSGLSLIELMVAMTLGLMITMTLGYILMGSRSTYRTQDASARVQDTGRFAMDLIGRQLRSAGRVDITPLASDTRNGIIGLPAGWTPITGAHGAVAIEAIAAGGGSPAVAAVAAVNASGEVTINGVTRQTDTLAVQYQLTNQGGNAIVDCNGDAAGIALTAIVGGGSYGTVSNIISVDGPNLELECTGNGGGGAQPFAEGVEDLQIRYAEAATPSTFNTVPTNLANVVAVQVCIMVQSPGNGVVTAPQTIRDCSGADYTPNDTRLRRTFTSVFTLRSRINAVP